MGWWWAVSWLTKFPRCRKEHVCWVVVRVGVASHDLNCIQCWVFK